MLRESNSELLRVYTVHLENKKSHVFSIYSDGVVLDKRGIQYDLFVSEIDNGSISIRFKEKGDTEVIKILVDITNEEVDDTGTRIVTYTQMDGTEPEVKKKSFGRTVKFGCTVAVMCMMFYYLDFWSAYLGCVLWVFLGYMYNVSNSLSDGKIDIKTETDADRLIGSLIAIVVGFFVSLLWPVSYLVVVFMKSMKKEN